MKKKGYNLKEISYFSLFVISLFFILLERITIPKINMTPYRILVGILLFFVFVELIKLKRVLVSKDMIFFISFLILSSIIGLEKRNIVIFMTYVFMSIVLIIFYNLLIMIKIDSIKLTKLSFIISIILFISSITLITDYFSITKFYLIFNENVLHDLLHGRGSSILGGEPNLSASRICSLLPFNIFYIIYGKKTKITNMNNYIGKQFFSLLTLFITVIAIILTGSRMGLLAVGLIIFFVLFKEIRSSKFIIKVGVTFFVIVLIILMAFSMKLIKDQKKAQIRLESISSISKFDATTFEDMEHSMFVRLMLFSVGIQLIKNNPIFGVGIGNAKYLSIKYLPMFENMKHLHNTYLDIGSENGLIMLAIFLYILFSILWKSYKCYLRKEDDFCYYFSVAFFILIFCFFFLSDFSNKLYWNFFLPLGFHIKNFNNEDVV